MANTTEIRERLAIAFGANALYASLHTADPSTTGASELSTTGGSPSYARKAVTWVAGSTDGSVTATIVFDVPSGITVVGAGFWTTATGGVFLSGGTVTSQTFSAQGTYTLTVTFSQS